MDANHREEDCTALALDTSSSVLAAAITRNGRTVDASHSFTERNHSVRVVSDLQDLMKKNGLTRAKVDVIAVGQGPGSYTGVRIAVSAAKTLAWAWNKPLVGVSSLEATAFSAWTKLEPRHAAAAGAAVSDAAGDAPASAGTVADAGAAVWIVPLMDARRGQAYTSLFTAGRNGEWASVEKDGIRLVADWVRQLRERYEQLEASERPSAVYLVGELAFLEGKKGPALDLEALSAGWPLRLEPSVIDAGAVGVLAERRFRLGVQEDIHGFAPNYTQLTEAEVNLIKAGTESRI
ncbi:tRNA (adenosine(37)-N6)-threonylcarbamoyltransferase complex dimerization subunit type 1 TsaB [Cohnella lubricantis]|uniref:tRNA (Adenosine(37)-N6)-threonylcarbamoyltransferase complex dimerization subunit type 1 TsaB n=1 Tax=Cohnella lubricantis TaxID=2163172 RepID=A0A841TIR3_9BACL|nr:tRNA (adenosine(37)-N6)-threonylcarbamoyltransferase complex dimerization subunit type 1 TsaB [Cohnella lubricantis]MBB6679749.1 tRNA (adenosine(37)-N6)-threonylcarbamoyltransferase complex dimerization subunit type 1 TsaB [Cohnella lubricantis]MBP2119459.1 tRNA threonylcarbamoyladenosine biosynthesis protein TsaB [Cohnella lubricantis]